MERGSVESAHACRRGRRWAGRGSALLVALAAVGALAACSAATAGAVPPAAPAAGVTTAAHRTAAHRTAAHRTAAHRTAAHRTAEHRTAGPATAGLAIAPAAARPAKSGGTNPAANLPPDPNYVPVCFQDGTSSDACRHDQLAALQHAHAVEHVRPLVLPRDFWSLSAPEQVFVLTNLERVDRGLAPVVGMTAPLDAIGEVGALALADPRLPGWSTSGDPVWVWGSIWAAGLSPMDADYEWMYEDGWGGAGHTMNVDCTSAASPGCWSHRDIMLGGFQDEPVLLTGTAVVAKAWRGVDDSLAQIIVGATGPRPPLLYSWASAVRHGAR